MKVSDIMTSDPLSVEMREGLERAVQLIEKAGVRHLPVLEEGRLRGVISQRDVLGTDRWYARGPARERPAGDRSSRRISDLVSESPVTIGPDEMAVAAIELMLQKKIGCLPVLRDDALVGILSEYDVLEAFAGMCAAEDTPADLDPPVSKRMTRNLVQVSPKTSREEAQEVCRTGDFRHLLVMVEDELVGLVSDRDLRTAEGLNLQPGLSVQLVMTRVIRDIHPEARLSQAARMMRRHGISCLPVVQDERPVGILTTTDLLLHCMTAFPDVE